MESNSSLKLPEKSAAHGGSQAIPSHCGHPEPSRAMPGHCEPATKGSACNSRSGYGGGGDRSDGGGGDGRDGDGGDGWLRNQGAAAAIGILAALGLAESRNEPKNNQPRCVGRRKGLHRRVMPPSKKRTAVSNRSPRSPRPPSLLPTQGRRGEVRGRRARSSPS